jgi:Ca-activated chloride channel family protein
MIRIEELLNFVPYELNEAKDGLFEVTREMTREGDKGFLFLGIKAKDAIPARKNIVLLIDTSGSMDSKKLQIRAALATVFAGLNENDVFSVVTYSSEDHTFIDGMKVSKKHDIDFVLDKLKTMYIEGCTNGSKGIETAYTIVEENFIEDGINRVILVTDGDLNFGITDKGGLIDLIEEKRKTGAYLSCIGTGLYNLRDDKLEALAKNGNGNYFVVNDIADVKEILCRKYNSLVFPVAKNVKAQVEFNPSVVKGYRLIGFENRRLTHEQFRDDKVSAEPFGSGAYCIACYELFFSDIANVKPLKYRTENTADSDELGTLTVRYQNVQNDEYNEQEFVLENVEASSDNLVKAQKCSELAEILRGDDTEGKKRKAVREYLSLFAGTEYAESFED